MFARVCFGRRQNIAFSTHLYVADPTEAMLSVLFHCKLHTASPLRIAAAACLLIIERSFISSLISCN